MSKRVDVWNSETVGFTFIPLFNLFRNKIFSDIDTDELDSDTKNVEEEIVEFFIKEEIVEIQ